MKKSKISIQKMLYEEKEYLDIEIKKLEEKIEELKFIWFQDYAWRDF